PAAIATMRGNPGTRDGDDRSVFEPSPSWPCPFPPQAQTSQSAVRASPCRNPPETAVTLAMPGTAAGVPETTVRPTPSSPEMSLPQARTLPSAFTARTCDSPAERKGVAASVVAMPNAARPMASAPRIVIIRRLPAEILRPGAERSRPSCARAPGPGHGLVGQRLL